MLSWKPRVLSDEGFWKLTLTDKFELEGANCSQWSGLSLSSFAPLCGFF